MKPPMVAHGYDDSTKSPENGEVVSRLYPIPPRFALDQRPYYMLTELNG